MIKYKCICGDEFIVSDNSEETRTVKRKWKSVHYKDMKNLGHARQRLVIRKKD